MIGFYARSMNQRATYWAPGSVDQFGKRTFTAAPALLKCRWQDQADMIRTPQGREVATASVAYTEGNVENGGYLALGDHTGTQDPLAVADAREIKNVARSPNIRATMQLVKAWL